jgi:hypothetical protein
VDESTERWLPYPGFAGFYEVSDWGNVMSLPRQTTRGKLLTPVISKKGGYRTFSLSKYGKVTRRRGARMVLETFDKPCPPGMEACHGPAGKIDRLDNLYWGTLSRNHKEDRERDGTDNRGERSTTAVLTKEIVLECRRRVRSRENPAGETQAALAAEFGVSSGAMNMAIKGKTWANLDGGHEGTTGGTSGGSSGVSRGVRGEDNVRSKLTAEIVLECRRRVRSRENPAGETQAALAAEFGVSYGAMNGAIHGRTWAHLAEGILEPNQGADARSLPITTEMREQRREYGRKGAEARWG